MKLWLIIVVALLFQELISTNAVLLDALHMNYNLWIIHGIFVITTSFGIAVGYWIGKLVQKIFLKNKTNLYFKKRADQINGFMGNNGTRLSLVFLSIIDFNFMDSFLSSWLPIPFWEIFTFLFIGNLLWYVSEWLLILGINTYFHNIYEAFSIVIAASVVITIIFNLLSKNLLKRIK